MLFHLQHIKIYVGDPIKYKNTIGFNDVHPTVDIKMKATIFKINGKKLNIDVCCIPRIFVLPDYMHFEDCKYQVLIG